MKKYIICLFLSVFVFQILQPCNKNGSDMMEISIIPQPLKISEKNGFFKFTSKTKIFISEKNYKEISGIAEYFSNQFYRASGMYLDTAKLPNPEENKGIIFELNKNYDKNLGDEGYTLLVEQKKIQLKANKPAGLFYAVQTLFQLMPVEIAGAEKSENTDWIIPCVSITDKPRYVWRGMHLDVSRHFFPKEFIKKYIDLIAMHKMNVFHWHLTDDNGWRIEIDKYPELTEISAWRVDREKQPWNNRTPPEPGEKATYGGFYTKEDVREIVEYAKEKFVTVIPEIEMPGHTSEVLAAYPELSCTGGPFYVKPGGYWPNIDIFCAGNEETFNFLEDVIDEVIEMFPAKYIHIGGDEADKTRWKTCKKCQQRIKDEGLKNEEELQSWFIKKIEKYLNSKGKQLIGWDEILEGGLAPEATVMSWRGFEGGIDAVRQDHDVVMSPVSHCYFDYYQANPEFEPKAIGGFTTLKKVYSFEPTPPVLNQDEAVHILGAQGNVWTEYISTPEHAEYMAVPRMSALAEVAWSPKEKRNWECFRQRLEKQFSRFRQMNVNYSEGSFAVDFVTKFDTSGNKFAAKFETEQIEPEIRYTLDGSIPTTNSPVYNNAIEINETTTIKAAIFGNNKMKEEPSEKTIVFHNALGKPVKYKTKPNFKYQGAGNTTLVDGIRGSKNHRDGLWQGFKGENLEVEIDLGSVIPINTVSATFFQRWKSWVFLPEKFSVSLSKNGKKFGKPKSFINKIPSDKDGKLIEEFKINFKNKEARYIKITAKNIGVCPGWHKGAGETAWLFVDEIVVD